MEPLATSSTTDSVARTSPPSTPTKASNPTALWCYATVLGTAKAEIPDASEKGFAGGSDPLAIYNPTGAKEVDAAKAMANFRNCSFAAVNAIASEVSNIQFRLYQIKGDDHAEQEDHAFDALGWRQRAHDGHRTQVRTMAHLELAGTWVFALGWRAKRHA